MNRRDFFRRTVGAVVVAPFAPSLWARWMAKLEAAARWRRMSRALTASMRGLFNPSANVAAQYRAGVYRMDILFGYGVPLMEQTEYGVDA